MVELMKKNIAVLGGSFDPPTINHLQIVCEVYNSFEDINEVWIVPCGDERPDATIIATSQQRLAMIQLLKDDLITDSIPIKIIDIETKDKFIPTFHLLEKLKKMHVNFTFEFIFGSNIINEYLEWENGLQLQDECKFIILERPNISYELSKVPKNLRRLPISIDLGDGKLKERIQSKNKKQNFGLNGLTSKSVIKYIIDNALYLENLVDKKKD